MQQAAYYILKGEGEKRIEVEKWEKKQQQQQQQ